MEIKDYKQQKQKEMLDLLYDLIENWEDEIVEFKEASNSFKLSDLGEYFSAISNEANLHGLQHGWLVFGVKNKTREIVGSNYRDTAGLQSLKNEIAHDTTGGIPFIDIYEVYPEVHGEVKRVIMFQIPAALAAVPTAYKNIEYGRVGESIVPLPQEKRERIRRQTFLDWSKQYVQGASVDHLDERAIKLARQKYKERMNDGYLSAEVDDMSDEAFLTRLKLIVNGKVTNAAMLLLGNPDYDYLMQNMPEASWRVYGSKDDIMDYKIFKIPYIMLSDKILENIRNLTYRYMPDQMTLFPMETKQYDTWVLRELLNNCIAHTDYTVGGRIYINEFEDKLILTNPGSFIPKSIEPILRPSYTSPFYRNQLLADAMQKFKMIDTEATGIRKVFNIQREKYFPLPEYDLDDPNKVVVTIYGHEINEKFTHILHDNENLDLTTVYLLDQVQKGNKISKDAVAHLRKYKLIEGRIGNLYLAAPLARTAEEKAAYIKNKGFDNKYYQDMIIDYLEKYGKANKASLRILLEDKLPESLSKDQKERKILTLLTGLKKKGLISRESDSRKTSWWVLTKK
jgi:ATP-dependent DNA helicase RecG